MNEPYISQSQQTPVKEENNPHKWEKYTKTYKTYTNLYICNILKSRVSTMR